MANVSRTDRNWSPRAGLVYQPSAVQSYHASFSRSFLPSGGGFALTAANAQIAPGATKNKEAGAKYVLFNGCASAGVSIFQRTNIKTTDPQTLLALPLGAQRTNGMELTFNGGLGNGF